MKETTNQYICPICLATIALAAAGAATTGGLTALAVRKFYRRSHSTKNKGEPNEARADQ